MPFDPDTQTLKNALRLYTLLSKFPYFKGYLMKIMLVAFIGTHVPLLTLLFFLLIPSLHQINAQQLQILGIALGATLVGTTFTLLALYNLLTPVVLTSKALETYQSQRVLPCLPTQYSDLVGLLMANVMKCIYQLDDALERITHYDAITGLQNRTLFQQQLSQCWLDIHLPEEQLLVICLDLDNFRTVNTVMGCHQGDQLLQQVAQRLRAQLNLRGSLARLGNDEFGIALACSAGVTEVIAQIANIRSCFAQPYYLSGKELYVTASMGVARCPSDTDIDRNLLNYAETALKKAKQQGANSYCLFDQEITLLLQERLQLETDLRTALSRQQFLLQYQPRVHLLTQKIVGVEALMRWQHPTLGIISPVKFILVAEETGLIEDIGLWALQTACQQQKEWEQAGFSNLKVSVNLSPRQLEQDNLIEKIDQILVETAINPLCLELEVTESFFMQDLSKAQRLLAQISQRGISLALDDFGTGYASLSYLRQLPFDSLKIDRAFVQDVVTDNEAASIARMIISLGQNLKLNLVAEGIETLPQLDYFRGHSCDEVQGYFFSPPASAAAVFRLLKKQQLSDCSS